MLAVTAERNTLYAGLAELFDDLSFAALSRSVAHLRPSRLRARGSGGGGGAADAFRDALPSCAS